MKEEIYPPMDKIRLALRHCPGATITYLDIWQRANENGHIDIPKKSIKMEYLMSPTMFANKLIALSREGLIKVGFQPKKFVVDIVGYERGV